MITIYKYKLKLTFFRDEPL